MLYVIIIKTISDASKIASKYIAGAATKESKIICLDDICLDDTSCYLFSNKSHVIKYILLYIVTGGLDPKALTALDASGFNADSE